MVGTNEVVETNEDNLKDSATKPTSYLNIQTFITSTPSADVSCEVGVPLYLVSFVTLCMLDNKISGSFSKNNT